MNKGQRLLHFTVYCVNILKIVFNLLKKFHKMEFIYDTYLVHFQFCTHAATSDKTKFPTFARTRPPDTQISKSVASVLTAFNWTHVSSHYAIQACSFL